jgi:hypothetical protein
MRDEEYEKALKHFGVVGMHWGKRAAKNIKDWRNGKSFRIGKEKGQSNREFDRQFAKDMGISVKESKRLDKQYGAQRKAVFDKIGAGASRAKSALDKVGHNLYKNSPIKNKKVAMLVDVILAGALVGGAVLVGRSK